MKKNTLTVLFILLTAPFFMRCASQSDVNNLNYQLRIVNKKIEDMKVGTVGQMQKRQAASSSQLDELNSQILSLKGQLEEMAHYNRQLKEQNKEFETSLQQYIKDSEEQQKKDQEDLALNEQQKDAKIKILEEKLSQQQLILTTIQKNRIEEAQRRADAAARAAAEANARANASSKALANSKNGKVIYIAADKKKIKTSTSTTSSSTSGTGDNNNVSNSTSSQNPSDEKDLIETADKEYAAGSFSKAYSLYEKYAESNNDSKSITARFMMGECLFYQKEYDQAILQYQKIISNHPNHPRAASALLKQGVAFENLADFETAKIIYKKIAASYSSSPEAAMAKERSAKLN